MPVTAVSLPDPEVIRRKAEEVIQRSDYGLEPSDVAGDAWRESISQLLLWLITPLRWLYGLTAGLSEWLRWVIVIALLLILVLLIVHILYTVTKSLGWGPKRVVVRRLPGQQERFDPAALERQADEALARHDYITAIRLLFQSILLRLEEHEGKKYRPGTTNREYLSRYRKSPIFASMKPFVEAIDIKWYGQGMCSLEDYELCQQSHRDIRRITQETKNADGT